MTEIYINGQAVDLPSGLRIPMTYQVNDIGKLDDRQANYSTSIQLPYTKKNADILGAMKDINIVSATPYQYQSARIVQDGVETISNGEAIVKGVSGGYQVNIVSGNRDIFRAIKGKKLKNLDLAAHNVPHTLISAEASRLKTGGYIWAIIDFGYMHNILNPFRIDLSFPSFFVHTLWSKIFSEANITYAGDVFDSVEFKNLIIPCNKFVYASGSGIGGLIDISASLPDMTQGDFFNQICQKLALSYQIDPYSRTVKFWKMSELSSFNAVDWNDKRAGEAAVKYSVGRYAQRNAFKYKASDDVLDTLGEGEILIADEKLPELTTLIQSKFAACEEVTRASNSVPFILGIDRTEEIIKNYKTPRILQLEKEAVGVQTMTDGIGGSTILLDNVPLCYFSQAGKPYNLDFESIIARHYSWLESMLDDAMTISQPFLLKPEDILSLDHSKTVFVNNNYFYINRVDNYLPGKITNVELIRI